MKLAIFDLDNTLLHGDSDYHWGAFLCERNLVDVDEYEQANVKFFDDYKAGQLDIDEYLRFALKPLTQHPVETLNQWRADFVKEKIEPIILDAGRKLIAEHKAQGHECMIITATNRFITEPIAQALGIDHLLATTPEMKDGRYTGNYVGEPTFQAGKILALEHWLERHEADLSTAWFYSDSHNDLPLLEKVSHPVVVDGDEILLEAAKKNGWKSISLRD